MNATLEEMARALFKSWFVDFDPVRAKMEGRETGLPVEMDGLLAKQMTGSDAGEIPQGWSVQPLGELIDLAYGRALKAGNRRPGIVPVYGSNGQIDWHYESMVSGPGIIVGRKGNPGTVTWSATDFFPIDTTFFVLPKARLRSLHFLFFALKAQNLALLTADSAVPGLNRNMAYMNKQVVPPFELVDCFDRSIRPIFARIHLGNEESRTLTALRDTLLPKLISGELRVGEADKLV